MRWLSLAEVLELHRRLIEQSGGRPGLRWVPFTELPGPLTSLTLDGRNPKGVCKHDAQDGNGDAHLKAGLVGPSETVPLIAGTLGLSRWQNLFFCEFDGPRSQRNVVVTVLADH